MHFFFQFQTIDVDKKLSEKDVSKNPSTIWVCIPQVLVHGEQNEMSRLKAALIREYEDDPNTIMHIHNPRNTHSVELSFRGEKTAKVMGSLAVDQPEVGKNLSGILVKRNFNYHILSAEDLPSK